MTDIVCLLVHRVGVFVVVGLVLFCFIVLVFVCLFVLFVFILLLVFVLFAKFRNQIQIA